MRKIVCRFSSILTKSGNCLQGRFLDFTFLTNSFAKWRGAIPSGASQGNGALTSLLGCDLIGTLPPDTPPLPAGAAIDAWWTGRNEAV